MEQTTFDFMDGLTSLPEERPARTCLSQESGRGCRREAERAPASPSSSCGLPASFDPDMCYGRTWRAVSIPRTPPTSSDSPLRLENAGILVPGESSTPNGSPAQIFTRKMAEWTSLLPAQFRSGAGGYGCSVCGLSDVLEGMSPALLRYFLSETALRGILRRAAARGKALPTLLKDAIEWMLGWWEKHPELEAKETKSV